MNKSYIINYHILNKSGQILKAGEMKVKKAMNDFHAKIKLEIFLKKKYPSFDKLIVNKCVVDFDGTNFMDYFKDIINNG